MKAKYIVGGIIIVVFAVWGITNLMSTTISYVTISEAPRSPGTIQVMGEVDFETVHYDVENSQMSFVITDPEDETGMIRLKIVYSGTVPGNFEQATSVVVKGQYRDNAFMADQLLVKCPSKYQGLEEEA